MDYVIVGVFGLAVGALMTTASAVRRGWLAFVASSVVLVIGIGFLIYVSHGSLPLGLTLAGAVFLGSFLAGPVAWRDHPLLTGFGYWSRAWLVWRHYRLLRESLTRNQQPYVALEDEQSLR